MPRKPRLDTPGSVQHVWTRGVVQRPIVLDDADRFALRDVIDQTFAPTAARALTWVFMTNHLHLVVRMGETPLRELMHGVLSRYAHAFNRRHEGSGHVFQGRYESRPVYGEMGLRWIVRYVLRNPIDAGMIPTAEALETYRWCSYPTLLGARAAFDFEDPAPVLELFEGKTDALRAWVADEGVAERRAALYARLLEDVCREFEVTPLEIVAGSRRLAVCRARTAICRRAFHDLGFSNVEIARRLRVSRSAVTQALRRC
jgi:REP element-mobilizing transposase RayT